METSVPAAADMATPRVDTYFRKATISGTVRVEIALRYGAVQGERLTVECAYCDATGDIYWWPGKRWVSFVNLEMDHVVPEFRGGPTTAANLVLACRRCNRRKGWR